MGGPAIIDGKTVHAVDNFLPSDFVIDGVTYYSAENYFQCAKCADPTEREKVRKSGTGCDVWSAGSRVQMRSDWEKIKVRTSTFFTCLFPFFPDDCQVRAMYTGNKAKFEQNPKLAKDLTSTKGEVIFTGNNHKETPNN